MNRIIYSVWRCGIVIVTAEVTVRWKDICWSADGEKAAAVSGGQQIRWRESALENWWFWEQILRIILHCRKCFAAAIVEM